MKHKFTENLMFDWKWYQNNTSSELSLQSDKKKLSLLMKDCLNVTYINSQVSKDEGILYSDHFGKIDELFKLKVVTTF